MQGQQNIKKDHNEYYHMACES